VTYLGSCSVQLCEALGAIGGLQAGALLSLLPDILEKLQDPSSEQVHTKVVFMKYIMCTLNVFLFSDIEPTHWELIDAHYPCHILACLLLPDILEKLKDLSLEQVHTKIVSMKYITYILNVFLFSGACYPCHFLACLPYFINKDMFLVSLCVCVWPCMVSPRCHLPFVDFNFLPSVVSLW